MKNVQRVLGIFAASAAMGLGMAGCDEKPPKQAVVEKTAQGTPVSVYPQGHLVRERVSEDLAIGADFKQRIYFKTMLFGANHDGIIWRDSVVTSTIQIPFADIKDQETLDKIAYLKTFYDQAMGQNPAVAAPTPTP
jgi:hypothetical protein